MGFIFLIIIYSLGIYICFHIFSKTVLYVIEPMEKHLKYLDEQRLIKNSCDEYENDYQDLEVIHEHKVTLEDDSKIVHLSKVILKKLISSNSDEDVDFKRR